MLPVKNRFNVLESKEGMKTALKGRFFSVKWRFNGLSYIRAGVIIGKRYSSLAVRRNALKREIFRVFEEGLKNGELSAGADIVVSVLTNYRYFSDNTEEYKKELSNVLHIQYIHI